MLKWSLLATEKKYWNKKKIIKNDFFFGLGSIHASERKWLFGCVERYSLEMV